MTDKKILEKQHDSLEGDYLPADFIKVGLWSGVRIKKIGSYSLRAPLPASSECKEIEDKNND